MTTTTETISWFSRLKDAFAGILFGALLFAASFYLLFWNEGRAVREARSLEEGLRAVVEADANAVDPAKEGKLVHISGLADTTSSPADPLLSVSAKALRLRRTVEMYQWQESRETKTTKNAGGSETKETTYSYSKNWSESPVSSRDFKEAGHTNPETMPLRSETWRSPDAFLGAHALTGELVDRISAWQPVTLDAAAVARASAALNGPWRLAEGRLYLGADPATPQIGDLRVLYEQVPALDISLVSRQSGKSFEPYLSKSGRTLQLLTTGRHGSDEMFAAAQRSNEIITWLLRSGGWLLMTIGLGLILRPLSVMADVIPFLGGLVGAGTGLIAALVSVAFSLATIGVAWVYYRPVLGGILLAAAAAAVFMAWGKLRRAGSPALQPASP